MLLTPLVGAIVLVALGIGHSVLGEILVVRPLLASELPPFLGSRRGMRRVIRVSWHLSTIAWWGIAAVFAYAAVAGSEAVLSGALGVLAATLGVTAAVALVSSRGRHPAWAGFAVAAALSWFARQ